MPLFDGYALFVGVVRIALLWLAVAAAVVALFDWAVRTRRISPFSGTARFFRNRIDPLMLPMERAIVRAGGRPSAAPWWSVAIVVVGGLALLWALDLVGALLQEASIGVDRPSALPLILVGWLFRFLEFALLVRVIASWFRIAPFKRWIRWAYVSTEWMLAPLRAILPPVGGVLDFTPLVAYLVLSWLLAPAVLRLIGAAVGA